MKKRCGRCGKKKRVDAFHRQTRAKDGRKSWCKLCHRETERVGQFLRNLFKLYGITKVEYDVMAAAQGGQCAICGDTFNETACVDHDHKTGKVRGLLCNPCNIGLGGFKDDPVRLAAAVRYLQRAA